MEELLTVKEVQDLLKVDRITVYRMLKDGRLTGVKIGQQWRFQRQEVDGLLSGGAHSLTQINPIDRVDGNGNGNGNSSGVEALPVHCVQLIQNVFAEVAQIGSVTTDAEGKPITEFSNSCAFCSLIMGTEKGRQGCIASWRALSNQHDQSPRFATCHAGLQYARAPIDLKGHMVAMLIAGQFYADPPEPAEEEARVRYLSTRYGIDLDELAEAARDLPVLDDRKRAQIGKWLGSVAHTFEDITQERASLMARLRTIAAMSAI